MTEDFYKGWKSAALILNTYHPHQAEVIKEIQEATDVFCDLTEHKSTREFYRGQAKGFLSAFGF